MLFGETGDSIANHLLRQNCGVRIMTVITGAAVFVGEGRGWSGLVLFIFKSYDDKMR